MRTVSMVAVATSSKMDELIIFGGLALKAARHAPGRIFSRAGGRFAIRVLAKAKVPTAPNTGTRWQCGLG